jgi:hypothetical protein
VHALSVYHAIQNCRALKKGKEKRRETAKGLLVSDEILYPIGRLLVIYILYAKFYRRPFFFSQRPTRVPGVQNGHMWFMVGTRLSSEAVRVLAGRSL